MSSIISSIKSSRPFLGSTLEVRPAPVQDRVLVTNLKESIGETILYYFEQNKYNPDDLDDPVEIDLHPQGSSAIVRFKQPSIIPRVLQDKPSVLGPDATVALCSVLYKHDNSSAVGSEQSNSSRGRRGKPKKPRGGDNLLRGRGTRGGRGGLPSPEYEQSQIVSNTEENRQGQSVPADRDTQQSIYSSWDSVNSEPPQSTNARDRPSRGRGRNYSRGRGGRRGGRYPLRGNDGVRQGSEPPMGSEGQYPRGSVVSLLDLEFEEDDQKSEVGSGDRPPSGRNQNQLRCQERGQSYNQQLQSPAQPYEVPEHVNVYQNDRGGNYRGRNNRVNRGGYNAGYRNNERSNRGDQHGYRGNDRMGYRGDGDRGRGYGDRHHETRGGGVNVSRPSSVSGTDDDLVHRVNTSDSSQYQLSQVISIPSGVNNEKCLLLINLNQVIGAQHGCRTHVDKRANIITVSGMNQSSLTNTVEYIYRLLADMHSAPVDVSKRFAERLASKQGIAWVINFFKQQQLHAIYYLEANKTAKVISVDEDTAVKAAEGLSSQLQSIKIPYSQSNVEYVSSETWRKYVESTQKSYLVIVEVIPDRFQISIEGLRNDEFDLAVTAVNHQLARNQTTVEELRMIESQLRLLQLNENLFK